MKIFMGILMFVLSLSAYSHEFIVKPETGTVTIGQDLRIDLMVTEVYIKPDRLPSDNTQLHLITENESVKADLTKNEPAKLLSAKVAALTSSAFVLQGETSRLKTIKAKEKTDQANPPKTLKMESFAKALVNLDTDFDAVANPVGTRLEVLPLQNPINVTPGESLAVKILFDGKPVATRVMATYDGFSDEEHGYTTRTQSGEDGIASIPLTQSGLWMIRTKITSDTGGDGFDAYDASASLVFYLNL